MGEPADLRALTPADLEAFVAYSVALDGESGRDGDAYFGPYSTAVPLDADGFRARTRERWALGLDEPGWRRAWGAFVDGRLVGAATLSTGELRAGLHRVELGMGVLRPWRRRGLGRGLVEAVAAWCRAQPSIRWLDLGVFADNLPAQRLYRAAGFEEIGLTRDRWRVDEHSIDELAMTLRVHADSPSPPP